MTNTTDFPLLRTPTVRQSYERRKFFQRQQERHQERPRLRPRQDEKSDDDDDVIFFPTPSFSRDDDDDVDMSSDTSRDSVALVTAIVDDEHCSSTPKRQKLSDGIFRPLSSLLSPPPLLPKSTTFCHEIKELSVEELSFLALPDCPSPSVSSSSTSNNRQSNIVLPTVASSPRISLAPRCSDLFLPASSPFTASAAGFKIMKGKRLFDIDEDIDDDETISSQSSADEYKENPMNFMKENQDSCDNKESKKLPRSRYQSFFPSLLRNRNHHDRYSFANRRFVSNTNITRI